MMMPFASLMLCLVPLFLIVLVSVPIVGVLVLLAKSKK